MKSSIRGFSLVEILVSMTVLSIGLTSILAVTSYYLTMGIRIEKQERGLDAARAFADYINIQCGLKSDPTKNIKISPDIFLGIVRSSRINTDDGWQLFPNFAGHDLIARLEEPPQNMVIPSEGDYEFLKLVIRVYARHRAVLPEAVNKAWNAANYDLYEYNEKLRDEMNLNGGVDGNYYKIVSDNRFKFAKDFLYADDEGNYIYNHKPVYDFLGYNEQNDYYGEVSVFGLYRK